MKGNKHYFVKGIHDGMPIALGYFAVVITLGLAAKNVAFLFFSQAYYHLQTVHQQGNLQGLMQ